MIEHKRKLSFIVLPSSENLANTHNHSSNKAAPTLPRFTTTMVRFSLPSLLIRSSPMLLQAPETYVRSFFFEETRQRNTPER